MQYGLIGERLGHSFSPRIHAQLGDYDYQLCPLPPEALDAFLRAGDFRGLNVTIPYKRAVLPYCDTVDPAALAIGSVNTLVRDALGGVTGYNTDLFGMQSMAKLAGISLAGKKVLILGAGGTSLTAQAMARQAGAREVLVACRKGPLTLKALEAHADAQILINTTPVGMYPANGHAPVQLKNFPACQGVLDVIYNPLRTALLLDAQQRGIPCSGGLPMLVAQAVRASELFTGRALGEAGRRVLTNLRQELTNLVLVGMPGCGKSVLGEALAKELGKTHVDADEAVHRTTGYTPETLIRRRGEAEFRYIEAQVIEQLGKGNGLVLSTGGGCVVADCNYAPLAQNGCILHVQRALHLLASNGRPLSGDLQARQQLYQKRLPAYRRFACATVDNKASLAQAVRAAKETFYENTGY